MINLGLQHEFFIPIWRRIACVAFCCLWGIYEFAIGAPFWGTIFLGLGGIAFWQFFIAKWEVKKNK